MAYYERALVGRLVHVRSVMVEVDCENAKLKQRLKFAQVSSSPSTSLGHLRRGCPPSAACPLCPPPRVRYLSTSIPSLPRRPSSEVGGA